MPRPRNRKQLLLKLGVFLLLGAIVNVAVAWGMDISGQPTGNLAAQPALVTQRLNWHSGVDIRFGILHPPSWCTSGWPCDALMREEQTAALRAQAPNTWRHGLELSTTSVPLLNRDFVYLPVLPGGGGFAINTILYATILWLLFVTPTAARRSRRWWRIRHHRCPACGFIIAPGTGAASGGPCSECGAALPSSMRSKLQ